MSHSLDSLRSGFLYQAGRLPQNAALIIGSRVYTYAEAADIARRWATRLVDSAGGRPNRVGIFASRSETSYLGVLASLFAGSAFVPLNSRLPVERTRAAVTQANVDALLVDTESLPQLRELLKSGLQPRGILLPETVGWSTPAGLTGHVFERADLAKTPPLTTLPQIAPNDVAYLLFTSGSTGSPKGVPITHASVRAFLAFNKARYRLKPEDRLTQTFDQTFDLSVFDLFMAWENGACVCSMQPVELLSPFRFLEKHQITVWFSVPSVAQFLMRRGSLTPGSIPTLRWSLFCGEGLPRATAEAWQAAAPCSIVENLYGPTELTIACSAYRWDPKRSAAECINDLVPIGEVYSHLSHAVVDRELHDVPSGVAGELCIAGPQAFTGYWNAADISEVSFLKRTEEDGTAREYFRTGDLVMRRGNHYVYLGRRDQQIKIAGYRVELHEIEAVLRRAGCVDAVALAWPDGRKPDCLIAVVSGIRDTSSLASAARQFLPGYMVPRDILAITEMPLNSNGKVDRDALRQWLADKVSLSVQSSNHGTSASVASPQKAQTDLAIEPVLARALGINVEQVHDDLSYQSIPEWDSVRHVGLLIALEAVLGRRIADDLAPHLCSVAAIRKFASTSTVDSGMAAKPAATPHETSDKATRIAVYRGLEGIHVDRSTITRIDGNNGVLEYRGYSVSELAERSSFEETAWLLLHGELPNSHTLQGFKHELGLHRELPPRVVKLIGTLADAHPLDALRTGVSALGSASKTEDDTKGAARLAGLRLIAQIPTLIATHHAIRRGKTCPTSAGLVSHAENILTMLVGQQSANAVRVVDKILIIHADHGANASAFAGRVAIGTEADLYAAITAAVATFSGALHGGAIERILELIDRVGTPDNAEAFVRSCLLQNKPVMGFGHRVYHCDDPRVLYMREAAHQLSRERGNTLWVAIIEALRVAMEPYAQHGIHPNVDLYAGVIYRLLGIPDDLAGTMFIAGRIAGWVAQALEQKNNNVLIRPLLHYVGAASRPYQPIASHWPDVRFE